MSTKKETVDAVVAFVDVPKSTIEKVLRGLADAAEDSLRAGETLKIPGIGTLDLKFRAGRQGRNPATGAPVQIPDLWSPKIRFEKSLKDVAATADKAP